MKSLRASVPRVLTGISEEQSAQHWRLCERYVAQVNALRSEPQLLRHESTSGSALSADRRRRFGFEYNGMVLQEFHFGNQKAQAHEPDATSALKEALTRSLARPAHPVRRNTGLVHQQSCRRVSGR